jgi:uncharacterized Zn finger protein (UPF0148 family)
MRGMTAPACPVCATPYEPGADTCAFCGVSLREPEAKAEAETKTEAPESQAQAEPAPVADTQADAQKEPAAPVADADDLAANAEAVARAADADIPAASEPPETRNEAEPAGPVETAEDTETSENPADFAPVAPAAPGSRAPSFARATSVGDVARRRAQRIEWGVVAGLCALLLVQVVASDFDQLAASATTRPWLLRMCNVLRCHPPAWSEPQALRLLQRDVRANPRRPGTLRISASFRNDARWTQPWPRLRVTLSDADGRAIAARDFAAREYLGPTPTANGIASGQVAAVAFDVVDPSPRVTAFTFEFHEAGMAGRARPR